MAGPAREGPAAPVARAAAVVPPASGAAVRPAGPAGRPGAASVVRGGPVGAPMPHLVGGAESAGVTPGATGRSGSAGVDAIRGARSEIRRQMREQRPLRLAVLVLACLLVLGAMPLYFGIRAAVRDPVFDSLDTLAVPGWAADDTADAVDGSRWCFVDCRFRERTLTSQRGPDETAQAYEKALTDAGWQPWKPALCPDQPVKGQHYTCWKRDELTLDLWVRQPACAADQTRSGQPPSPPAPDPSAAGACEGSMVSVKVRNAIADERTKPQPSTDPSLTGEDPDPVFTDDPLADLTPSPS